MVLGAGDFAEAKFRDDRERKGIVRMLRVGILGAGYFGAVHARALSALPEVQLVAVCAETKALAEAFLSIRRRSVRKGLADLAREIAANDDPSPNPKGRSKPE